jgi:ribosome-associated protein
MAIYINDQITIDEDELEFRYIRASGPGGQKINKASTAVQLQFDVYKSPSLPEDVRLRLMEIAGSRLTQSGKLIIEAGRHRTQERNRNDAIKRLVELIRGAAQKPVKRIKTIPTATSRLQRLERKRRQSEKKRMRRKVRDSDY